MQRWIAGRDGWRLHVVSRGRCQAAFVAGVKPQRIALSISRAGGVWEATVEGTKPALRLQGNQGDSVTVSLIADRMNSIRLNLGDATATAVFDADAAPSNPPYALSFWSDDRRTGAPGCAVVWADIPFHMERSSAVVF